jgi:hypothetical protein
MIISEISDFKKREIEHELKDESPNNYAVCINDKPWKIVSSRSRADKMANTLNSKGKNATVHITGAPVSEASQAKASDKKPKKIKPTKGHSSPHPMRGKLVGESQIDEVAPLALLRVGVPILAKVLKAGAKRPIRSTIALDAVDGELDTAKDILGWLSSKLAQFFDIKTLTEAAKIIFKYKIPVLGITAAVYGGKFLVDYLANAKGDARMQKTGQTIQQAPEMQTEDAESDLENKMYDLEAGLREARSITKNIKYADMHMEIITKLSSLAEKLGIKLDEYNERQVYEAMNNLESAVYELEEPFEDAIRDVRNKLDDIQYADEGSIPQKPKSYDKRNPVAKNIEKFNRPATHTDKKKDMKKGNTKHKSSMYDECVAVESKSIPFNQCPGCGGEIFHESEGKKDACYHKVKSRYKVWPSAYASGALVQCRKKGAKNWGNSSKK